MSPSIPFVLRLPAPADVALLQAMLAMFGEAFGEPHTRRGARQLQGENDLDLYQFNKNIARHLFCRHCGIHAFRRPRSNPAAYAVFDGRNWEAAQEARLNETRKAQ